MKAVLIEYQYYKQDELSPPFVTTPLHNFVEKRILITNSSTPLADKKTVVLNHTNKGKDIGAKLLGIDFLLQENYDFDILLFLHDKKSPHSPLGSFWFKELTKIYSFENLQIIKNELSKKEVGICCAKKYIKSEYNSSTRQFNTTNNSILQKLLNEYNLKNSDKFQFVAGTIFACKWKFYKTFFSTYSPLKIRTQLEMGNIQDNLFGTYTHSWERIFSWIITDKNQVIKGL